MSRPCGPCFSIGHICDAQEGTTLCVFCEDKVPCPVMKRAVAPSTAKPEHFVPSPPAKVPPKPMPAKTVHTPTTPKGATAKMPERQSEHQSVHQSTERDTCNFPEGCDKKLRIDNTSGYCKEHAKVMKKKAKKQTVPAGVYLPIGTPAKPNPVHIHSGNENPEARTAVRTKGSLCVIYEESIDRWWQSLSSEAKAGAFQRAFGEN